MKTEAHDILRKLDLEKLTLGKGYYPIPEAQLIFYYAEWESYVITIITEEEDYTVAHYNLLPEMAPYQLIHGKLIYMAAPSSQHQRVSRRLSRFFDEYVDDNELGEVFPAPYDVQFSDDSVVQPDLIFISIKQQHIIGKQRTVGAPEFVVEILSTNEKDDRIRKMKLYGEHDVMEYWIVAPDDEYIEVYYNEEREMKLVQKAEKGDTITSKAIEGFVLELDRVFK